MSKSFAILDTADVALPPIRFGNLITGTHALPTIRVKNTGTETPTGLRLTVCNADWTFAGKANKDGQEVVTSKYVQAKLGLGAWAAIGGSPMTAGNYIDLTPPAAGAYVEVQLQMVVPSASLTRGKTQFIIMCGVKYD